MDRQIVGNIGLYYVCYRLSRLGWNVMPTSRNAKGVDIDAYLECQGGTRKITVQVKALSRCNADGLGDGPLPHLIADYLIVCRRVQRDDPECYVMTKMQAIPLAHSTTKKDKEKWWIKARAYENPAFLDKWPKAPE